MTGRSLVDFSPRTAVVSVGGEDIEVRDFGLRGKDMLEEISKRDPTPPPRYLMAVIVALGLFDNAGEAEIEKVYASGSDGLDELGRAILDFNGLSAAAQDSIAGESEGVPD